VASIGSVNKEKFFAELEALGENEVRGRLAARTYTDLNEKARFAREWLACKDQLRDAELERRKDALHSEQAENRLARSRGR
jgi:hypothetical protein